MERVVGVIGNYNVIYVPEKDTIFCKNTAIKFPIIEHIITRSHNERDEIPEKSLTITKTNDIVQLGCLTTTMDNCLSIRRNVNKFKTKKHDKT